MPLVTVRFNKELLSEELLVREGLVEILRESVAGSLHVKGINKKAHLTPEDIEIRFQPHGEFDVGTDPLQIVVEAMHFPERAANLEERHESIHDELRPLALRLSSLLHENVGLNDLGYLQIRLMPSSFTYL